MHLSLPRGTSPTTLHGHGLSSSSKAPEARLLDQPGSDRRGLIAVLALLPLAWRGSPAPAPARSCAPARRSTASRPPGRASRSGPGFARLGATESMVMTAPPPRPPKSGQALLVNGVSVALDETAREVSERQVLARRGPAREIRAVAADNGPASSVLPFPVHQPTQPTNSCANLRLTAHTRRR